MTEEQIIKEAFRLLRARKAKHAGGRPPKLKPSTGETLRAAYRTGSSIEKLATQYDVSESTIRRIVKAG